jgi:hypothetical protein
VDVVILAGGLGRRFGGAKQFTAVAPDGATLLEITVRDAARAGCTRAVVVTAPGCEDEALGLFRARPVPGCEVVAVAQRPDDLPGPAPRRERPWGTAHAVWAARSAVRGLFLLFNADDHYGADAPAALATALAEARPTRFAMLGFPLGDTLSPHGSVSRAVAVVDGNGLLTALREYAAVAADGRVVEGPAVGALLPPDAPVSMNAWAFTPALFPLLEAYLHRFLAEADLSRDEAQLPAAVEAAVVAGKAEVAVVPAPDRWFGLTWPEDRARVAGLLAERAAVEAAARAFGCDPETDLPRTFGDGLINATWRVGGVLLQRINERVFADPAAVIRNAAAAAQRVDDALRCAGDDDPRHRLAFLPGPDGEPCWRDPRGAAWRAVRLIDGARPAAPDRPDELRAAARALGAFPGHVAAGQGPELAVTIPGFHDTPARLAAFRAAVAADAACRLHACRPLVDRLLAPAPLAERLDPAALPQRPVHNDAKPDNVLVDAATGEALCVVDLDTVMPGLAPHDFGDLVRAAVTGRPEDEPDLAKVRVRLDVFAELAAGWLEGARPWITADERAALVDGVLAIVYEQALRFLADHLAGDVYYRVADPEHNLRRARAQAKLLEELLAAEDDLRLVVARL